MASALEEGDIPQARILLTHLDPGISVPLAFSGVVAKMGEPRPGTSNVVLAWGFFENRLTSELQSSNIESYLSVISDPLSPLDARVKLFWVTLNGAYKFPARVKNRVSDTLVGIVNSPTNPSPLRATILRNLSGNPFNLEENIFLSYANSYDSLLKMAACQGLSRMVHENRVSGKEKENASLFSRFKLEAGSDLDSNEIRVFASFGEEYSRDYLLAMCTGDPLKFITILQGETNMDHPGLICEAARLLAIGKHKPELARAIRYSVQDPKPSISLLLMGSENEILAGLNTLECFPEFMKEYERPLIGFSHSTVEAIRNTSTTLLSRLAKK